MHAVGCYVSSSGPISNSLSLFQEIFGLDACGGREALERSGADQGSAPERGLSQVAVDDRDADARAGGTERPEESAALFSRGNSRSGEGESPLGRLVAREGDLAGERLMLRNALVRTGVRGGGVFAAQGVRHLSGRPELHGAASVPTPLSLRLGEKLFACFIISA